jgi:acetyl esterase
LKHSLKYDRVVRAGFSWVCGLFLFGWATCAFAREPDTFWTYKTVDGKELQMHVFLPEAYEAGTAFPAFVFIHGGSWQGGDPNWHYPDCTYWASRGMVAVSIAYRLKDRDHVEVPLECVKDAKSAIRFLRAHADELKIDPDRIVAAGDSAGGQLAAATATITGEQTNDDLFDDSVSCIPNAVILTSPYFKCDPSLSPPFHVKPGLPPFITFLGDQDPAIKVEDLLAFHDSLLAVGVDSEYYVGKGGPHGFCNGRNPRNEYFYWSVDLTDRFLTRHGILSGEPIVTIPEGVRRLGADDVLIYSKE